MNLSKNKNTGIFYQNGTHIKIEKPGRKPTQTTRSRIYSNELDHYD